MTAVEECALWSMGSPGMAWGMVGWHAMGHGGMACHGVRWDGMAWGELGWHGMGHGGMQ